MSDNCSDTASTIAGECRRCRRPSRCRLNMTALLLGYFCTDGARYLESLGNMVKKVVGRSTHVGRTAIPGKRRCYLPSDIETYRVSAKRIVADKSIRPIIASCVALAVVFDVEGDFVSHPRMQHRASTTTSNGRNKIDLTACRPKIIHGPISRVMVERPQDAEQDRLDGMSAKNNNMDRHHASWSNVRKMRRRVSRTDGAVR
jgi:hypothetical protein